MPIVRADRITRADVRAHRDYLWCFGDNVQRRGYGGQAREMRGEPNTVGIVTKWAPRRDDAAYFTDADSDTVVPLIVEAVDKLRVHLRRGGVVVVPAAGVGTGRAELAQRAPKVAALIDRLLRELDSCA